MRKPQPHGSGSFSSDKKKNSSSPAKKVTKNLFRKTEKRWSFTRKCSPNELSNLYHYIDDFVTAVPKKGTLFISKSNNGTVTIKVRPYVTDRVNIRRVQYNHILSKMEKQNKNMHSAFQPAFPRGGRSVAVAVLCIPTCIPTSWQVGDSIYKNLTEVFQKYTRRPLQRYRN